MAEAKIGRPTVMTPDTKDLFIDALLRGKSTRGACRELGIHPDQVYYAMGQDPEFHERYQSAKAICIDAQVDDAEEAAERAMAAKSGAEVAGIKVYVDHKWRVASRLAPQRWGEKAQVNVTGQIAADDTEMAKRIAFLEALQAGLENEEVGNDADP